MHLLVQIPDVGIQILTVGTPCDTVHACSRLLPQGGVSDMQQIDGHMVVERCELLFRPLSYGLPYAFERK
jgi:hypothetical protein